MGPPRFITLGPAGTCHENALLHYLDFQGLDECEVVLVDDLLEGVEQVRGHTDTFLVQCSAHLQVHLVTERYHHEVFVIDTFIYPTKELALLVRADVERPRSLGIVNATRGYVDLRRFERVIDEPSKPVVARHLLVGEYEAGLTHIHHAHEHPESARGGALRGGRHHVAGVWDAQALCGRGDRSAGAVVVRWQRGGAAGSGASSASGVELDRGRVH